MQTQNIKIHLLYNSKREGENPLVVSTLSLESDSSTQKAYDIVKSLLKDTQWVLSKSDYCFWQYNNDPDILEEDCEEEATKKAAETNEDASEEESESEANNKEGFFAFLNTAEDVSFSNAIPPRRNFCVDVFIRTPEDEFDEDNDE